LGVWKYRTEIVEPPAAGQIRFDNADISLATELYINETNDNGTDVSAFMDILLLAGSVLFVQDKVNAANRVFVECGAVTDEGTYRKIIITSVTEVGTEPGNNTDVIVVVQTAAGGGGGGGLTEYFYTSKDFDNPNNADWDLNALAPAAADSNNAALSVRLFDDAVQEGVGIYFQCPVGATNLVLELVSRAETAPGGAVAAKPAIEIRPISDNVAVISPPWTTLNLTKIDIPTNENFQYDSQTIAFAVLTALVAGQYVQMQLTRNPTHPDDDLVGDWVLLSLRVSFT